ncbi:MAG: DNA polymerase I [Betaproteobacteria bacterium]|nr:DNA polymerase I [Betaproteobacteria bacterium]
MTQDLEAERMLLLVDGSSYLYRAYHAMPDLRGPNGEPTGALYGMTAMLRRLRQQYPPAKGYVHAACVFDAKGPTFRNELYDQYKAHRPSMPEDLAAQVEPIREVVRLMGWPLLVVPGVEADDVIATLAARASARGMRTLVSTGDKDLAQLVDAHVTLVNTMTNETLDEAGVLAKFGVPPQRIVDYLCLIGDTADNVPGVPKVGPKTAVKWLQQYGSLQGIVEHAADIGGAVGQNLRDTVDWLPRARELITVRADCDLDGHAGDLDRDLHAAPEDEQALAPLFGRYGLKRFLHELPAQSVAAAPAAALEAAGHADAAAQPLPPGDYETVLTLERLQHWIGLIGQAALTALDTETDSLDPMHARLVGISLAVKPGQAAYIPLAHAYPACPQQLPVSQVLDLLRPWLVDPARPKLGQNSKYDRHVLQNAGIVVQGYVHDTLLQSYVLEAHKPHALDSLITRHLGRSDTLSYEQVCGKGAKAIGFDQVDLETATRYSGEDSDLCLQVHQRLWPLIEADEGLARIYALELRVSEVLQRMERVGVLIDAAALRAQSGQIGARMVELEQRAYELAGGPFNLGSPRQIGEALFGRLQLPVQKKTSGGAASTDEEVLEKLAEDYPLPRVILDHRGLSKLRSTYTEKLPQMVDPDTGRVHTNYAQAVAVTGRLASNDPNLQNIPVRTAEGRRIREAFVAPPGWRIASSDYSQIELRIMAHLSQDEGLLRAFAAGEDIHRATAAEIFGVPPAQVSSDQRRMAKVINFGLIYGMSAFGLARNLGLERDAAQVYIGRYFARYPGVAVYMERTREQAKSQGYVSTVFGRRLWLPEINSPNGPRRAAAQRAAINAPMQGTAADLIKMAMIDVEQALLREGLRARMVMQVHDELVLEVPEEELDWVREQVPALMAGVAQLGVPLVAELGTGPNWEAAH